MNRFEINDTVGEIVTRQPQLARVFEQVGVDYCCGGKKTLQEACEAKGLDAQTLVLALQAVASSAPQETELNLSSMSLTELANHIEGTHHEYLKSELPRLDRLTKKVAAVHGGEDERLRRVREIFLGLAEELSSHTMKEERVLFPMIRELEAAQTAPSFHCGSLSAPIAQMEFEHDGTGEALKQLRILTDEYTPPEWACNTYRTMLHSLAELESDTHRHIHKENNVLFPRALQMEQEKCA
ncbi:MAG TPA: iron-sulfur cluster repair di-iron protein [Acidobacteriota bacterium]|nr:iron-sulfur cluster repair di-iron protein [Acidobacteriota bacterium]